MASDHVGYCMLEHFTQLNCHSGFISKGHVKYVCYAELVHESVNIIIATA